MIPANTRGESINLGPHRAATTVDISVATHTKDFDSLYVGTAGNVVVTMFDDNNVTFNNVQDGTVLRIRGKAVVKASTTASNMVMLHE